MLASSWLIVAVVGVIFLYFLNPHWENALRDEVTRNLTQKTRMFAARVDSDHAHSIDIITSQEGQAAVARATVIDMNGRVVADSEIPVGSLEHEGQQPEFASALHGSVGTQTRSRNHAEVLYVAIPVSGGAVRLACPLADVEIASERANRHLEIALLVAALFALAMSAVLARPLSTR
ncbi:MAG TPA: hypothetical protein VF447_06280 [Terriglobales bacterium]